ncbi:helix-turn-helix domain-containing protein [Elizabethkingia anophelis]|uniref:helix-turn-helix domain-containing protein n=1 Tax=Elizabethkingia anophelis TaxID=1117645 RepID=UPI00136D5AC0|nr:helix-turn-helix domain-containing protein [Elizabethkingia anophelis]MYY44013.1 DNA-binding protein [Elizabethkingia anophelis]
MEPITKDDLRQLRMLLLDDIAKLLNEKKLATQNEQPDWLRSKAVRKILNISASSLQNLRITGKVGYRKILGSYYYSKTDLLKLFGNDNK